MKCQSCGAPLNAEDEVCEYCGTMTQYGMDMLQERKRLEQEEHRRHELENLPKIKYVPMPFVIVLCILTLGCYAPYWYITRSSFLKSLIPDKKFPVWAVILFVVSWGLVVILPSSEEENTSELVRIVNSCAVWGAIIVSVYLAFSVRKILQEYAAKFMQADIAVESIAPSGVKLALFGAIYLQSCVNKMIKMKLLAPKI